MIPRDELMRERARLSTANVIVEAGAGTGKTTLLVDRVVQSLAYQEISMSRMLLITFMDKAQAEMRRRVGERLQQLLATSGGELDDTHRRLALALESLPDAHITTIHGFCHGLLAEFGTDYGIPVGFQVLGEVEADRLWNEAFRSWISQHEQDEIGDRILRLLHAGIGWDQLVQWARQISAWSMVPEITAKPINPEDFVRSYAEAAQTYIARAREEADPADAGFIQIEEVARQFDWLFRVDKAEWPRMLAQWTRGLAPKGNKKNWRHPESLAVQKEWITALKEDLTILRRRMSDFYLAEWVDLIGRDFRSEWRRTRFEALSLTYDDLLWEAERITREPAVWSRIRDRFDLIMVDEFQDTDAIQAAIIRRLVTPVGEAGLTDDDAGRLFLVGDPKQSIYRFRGADVETYAAVRREVEQSGGAVLPITENFRSHPRILKYVNQIFSDRWPAQPDPDRSFVPAFIPLTSPYADDQRTRVQVLRLASDRPVGERRRVEGEAIGQLVATAVQEGWPVREQNGSSRPLGYGDIALVVPQRTEIERYRTALKDRNIPVSTQGGRAFFQQDEIRGLRHLYRSLENPDDAVAVVGWLLSPWVALTHDTLAQHHSQGGKWQYLGERLGHPAVLEWWQLLTDWHANFWRADAESVLDWAMSASPLLEVLQGRGDVAAIANLSQMRTLCRQFGDSWGIYEFSQWLDAQVTEGVPYDEASIPNVSEEVTITTVHQAKGLEWPMVIVANWSPLRTALEPGIHYNPRINRAGLHHEPWQSSTWESLDTDHRVREEAERDRLLYVALTRARDYLWFYASFLDDIEEYSD